MLKVKFSSGLLLALGLVIAAVSAAALVSLLGGDTGSYAMTVSELYAEDPSSTQRVRVVGAITDAGVSLERFGFAEFSITDEGGGGRELPVSVDRSVIALPDGVSDGSVVVVTGHLRGRIFEALELIVKLPVTYDLSGGTVGVTLTAMSRAEQAALISGESDILLDFAPEGEAWLGSSDLALWRDQYGREYVWDYAFNIIRDERIANYDAVPTRVYPGEATFEDCMKRAEALARKYYTGQADFDTLRRTTSRRINEGVTNGPINSYDVIYQRYIKGMPVRDLIEVRVYALSGGSDFVGLQLDGSDVPSETAGLHDPAVSLEQAISIAETELENLAMTQSADLDPAGWSMGHPRLEISALSGWSLVWSCEAVWEDPDPDPNRLTFGGPPTYRVTVDAIRGTYGTSSDSVIGLN